MSVRNTVKSIQDIMRQDSGVDGDAQRISQLCWMFFLKIIDDQDQQLELMQDGYHSPIPAETPVAQLGGRSRRHHGRRTPHVHQHPALSAAQRTPDHRESRLTDAV